MKADETYFNFQIMAIPVDSLKNIIRDEIMTLCYDHGQKVTPNDPDIVYIVERCTNILRSQYSDWKLSYLGECFNKGKLDEFDKGQKITMKRLEVWFYSYSKHLKSAVWRNKHEEKPPEYSHPRFAENSSRFSTLIKFRQLRKPKYDGEEWSLIEIEKTEDFQAWLQKSSSKSLPAVETNVAKKF